MKKTKTLLMIFLAIGLNSCNPSISTVIEKRYPPLDFRKDVIIFELYDSIPDNAEILGYIKIKDTGFTTNCDYYVIMDRAKKEARKAGGNAIKITEHKLPTAIGSTCHRIEATILKIDYKDSN